jgi:hypothetical protein
MRKIRRTRAEPPNARWSVWVFGHLYRARTSDMYGDREPYRPDQDEGTAFSAMPNSGPSRHSLMCAEDRMHNLLQEKQEYARHEGQRLAIEFLVLVAGVSRRRERHPAQSFASTGYKQASGARRRQDRHCGPFHRRPPLPCPEPLLSRHRQIPVRSDTSGHSLCGFYRGEQVLDPGCAFQLSSKVTLQTRHRLERRQRRDELG